MVYIYDIETYYDTFIICLKERDSGDKFHFEISNRKDQSKDLFKFLNYLLHNNGGMIGYNNLNFDYPVLHWMMQNPYSKSAQICEYAQDIIKSEENTAIWKGIAQLDLYKIWHYDNDARRTSLKYLEFAMRADNIGDLPYDIYENLSSEMIDNIIEYCYHDVENTYNFYLKSVHKIELRKKLSEKYGINLLNKSDVGIAETLLLDSYCKKTGLDKSYVRELRSEYNFIQVKDILFPQISFKTKAMRDWLENFKTVYLKRMEGFWKGDDISLFGETYTIAKGGLHIQQKPGIYIALDDQFIREWDCSGMYPTFISLWRQFPAHLGEEFLELYSDIRDQRMIAKKNGDKVMDAAGKIQGNGSYGKFGSSVSYLYDLKMLYTVTINNQLFLLMLIEECGLNDIKVISANTDSITIHDNNNKSYIFDDIKERWEKISKHTLENTDYKKIVYRDVNNYIALTTDNKVKMKGIFETFEKFDDKFDGWHKNQSMLVVAKALRDYYLFNKSIEESVKNCTDIFDFCKVVKGKKGIRFISRKFERGIKFETPLQKVNRYIISDSNVKIIKILDALVDENGNNKRDKLYKYREKNPQQLDMFHFVDDIVIDKDRESEIEANYYCTVLNKIVTKDITNYNINYNYYINECYKIMKEVG